MKHAKMLAIVAVAVFCVSAFAVAINVDNSSAEGEKLTYSFYLELKDGENSYKARLADVEVDGTAPTGELYKTALVKAATAAGLTVNLSAYGMVSSIVTPDHTYANSGDWGSTNYKDFAVYYYDGEWKASNLADKTMLAIVFDLYAFSEPSDASKYCKQQMEGYDPYWTALPTVEVVEYKIFIDCVDEDGTKFSKWTSSTQFGKSGNSLKSAKVLGPRAAGFEVENKWTVGMKKVVADGHTYSDRNSWGDENYWSFAGYRADGDKWVPVQATDVETSLVYAYTYNLYKITDPKDDTYYHHINEPGMEGQEWWTKLPSVSPSDADKKENNNLVLYIVIGAVAVVAVAAVAFFLLKKKA